VCVCLVVLHLTSWPLIDVLGKATRFLTARGMCCPHCVWVMSQ